SRALIGTALLFAFAAKSRGPATGLVRRGRTFPGGQMIALREGVATAARIAAFVPLRGDDSVPPCAVNSRLWHPGAKSSRFPSRSQRAAEAKDQVATRAATTKSSPIALAVCCRSLFGMLKRARDGWSRCAGGSRTRGTG